MTTAPVEKKSPLMLAALLLLPICVVNAYVFVWPILKLGALSFLEARAGGSLGKAFTWDNWAEVLGDPFYQSLVGSSVLTSLLITFLALICSYPIALYLHRTTGRWRSFLLVLVVAPLLTSAVVRTYGWIAILSDAGLIANTLRAFGVTDIPFMMFNKFGVVVGLTEIMMPYMILALMVGFGKLEGRFEEAAATLGASPFRVFLHVVLPLSAPGIALGTMLCFVISISAFITPKLLGGGRVFLLATEIYDQAIVTLNWPLASALSIETLVLFGIALAIYARLTRKFS